VAGLGSSVAWRRCSGRCRRSRRCRCSRWSRCSRRRTSPAAPVRAPAPGSRLLPLPARCGGGALLPWHVVGVPVWPRPSSARRSGGASFSSLSRRPLRWSGKGKPRWGWWLGRLALCLPPSLLNPGAATAGRNPLAAPAWTARATEAAPLPPLRWRGHRSVWRGGKRGFSPRSGFDSRVSAPDPSACGSPGWRGRPIARPPCAMRLG
jgi:hypothetical protein